MVLPRRGARTFLIALGGHARRTRAADRHASRLRRRRAPGARPEPGLRAAIREMWRFAPSVTMPHVTVIS